VRFWNVRGSLFLERSRFRNQTFTQSSPVLLARTFLFCSAGFQNLDSARNWPSKMLRTQKRPANSASRRSESNGRRPGQRFDQNSEKLNFIWLTRARPGCNPRLAQIPSLAYPKIDWNSFHEPCTLPFANSESYKPGLSIKHWRPWCGSTYLGKSGHQLKSSFLFFRGIWVSDPGAGPIGFVSKFCAIWWYLCVRNTDWDPDQTKIAFVTPLPPKNLKYARILLATRKHWRPWHRST